MRGGGGGAGHGGRGGAAGRAWLARDVSVAIAAKTISATYGAVGEDGKDEMARAVAWPAPVGPGFRGGLAASLRNAAAGGHDVMVHDVVAPAEWWTESMQLKAKADALWGMVRGWFGRVAEGDFPVPVAARVQLSGETGAVGRSLARVRLSYRTTEEAMIAERYLINERSGNLRGCIGERMGRGRMALAQYVSSSAVVQLTANPKSPGPSVDKQQRAVMLSQAVARAVEHMLATMQFLRADGVKDISPEDMAVVLRGVEQQAVEELEGGGDGLIFVVEQRPGGGVAPAAPAGPAAAVGPATQAEGDENGTPWTLVARGLGKDKAVAAAAARTVEKGRTAAGLGGSAGTPGVPRTVGMAAPGPGPGPGQKAGSSAGSGDGGGGSGGVDAKGRPLFTGVGKGVKWNVLASGNAVQARSGQTQTAKAAVTGATGTAGTVGAAVAVSAAAAVKAVGAVGVTGAATGAAVAAGAVRAVATSVVEGVVGMTAAAAVAGAGTADVSAAGEPDAVEAEGAAGTVSAVGAAGVASDAGRIETPAVGTAAKAPVVPDRPGGVGMEASVPEVGVTAGCHAPTDALDVQDVEDDVGSVHDVHSEDSGQDYGASCGTALSMAQLWICTGCRRLAVQGQCPGGRRCDLGVEAPDGLPQPAPLVKADELHRMLFWWSKAAPRLHERQADVRTVMNWLSSDSPGLRRDQRGAFAALDRIWKADDVVRSEGGGLRLMYHEVPAPVQKVRVRSAPPGVSGTTWKRTPATALPLGRVHRARGVLMPGVLEGQPLPGSVAAPRLDARRVGPALGSIAVAGAAARRGVVAHRSDDPPPL
jgi:hypothetical protein